MSATDESPRSNAKSNNGSKRGHTDRRIRGGAGLGRLRGSKSECTSEAQTSLPDLDSISGSESKQGFAGIFRAESLGSSITAGCRGVPVVEVGVPPHPSAREPRRMDDYIIYSEIGAGTDSVVYKGRLSVSTCAHL